MFLLSHFSILQEVCLKSMMFMASSKIQALIWIRTPNSATAGEIRSYFSQKGKTRGFPIHSILFRFCFTILLIQRADDLSGYR